jgi:hypothetical protein
MMLLSRASLKWRFERKAACSGPGVDSNNRGRGAGRLAIRGGLG